MSADVTAIFSHNLNTNSLQELAAELSERLEVTINYGYQDDLIIEGFSNQTFEFVSLGKIVRGTDYEYRLIDSKYLDNIADPSKNNGDIYYTLDDSNDDLVCFIYKHIAESGESYSSNWFSFCRHFTGEADYWGSFNMFRNQIQNQANLMGSDAALYYGGCSDDGLIVLMCEGSATFHEVYNKIKEVYPDRFINMSEFLTEQPDPIPLLKIESAEDYPEAFYDDFKVFREES